MLVSLLITVLVASTASERIQSHVQRSADTNLKSNFGASCDDLQTSFHSRLQNLQALLDAHPDVNDFTRATKTRFIMRSFGVVRTLRRARTCSWVVESESEDIQQTRAIVRALLAGNPCAEAALAELKASVSAGTPKIEIEALFRAMSVLMSDNCEPEKPDEESTTLTIGSGVALDEELVEAEAQAQDSVEEMVEAVERDELGTSFAQTSSNSFSRVMRVLGVVFLALLLLLACTSAAAIIGGLIGVAFGLYFSTKLWSVFFAGTGIGTLLGIGSCSLGIGTLLDPLLDH